MATGEAIGAVAGASLGMIQGQLNNNYNRMAQKQAVKDQMRLNRQGKELALQQWKDTNFSAQVREMKKAGLSVGLMNGGAGAGGGTTSTASGGSAPMQAPSNIDLGGMQGIQSAVQLGLMQAQKENIEANTNKTNVETSNIENPTLAGVAKTNEEKDAIALQNEKNKDTMQAQKTQIASESTIKQNEAHVSTNTYNTRIQQVKQELINEELKSETLKKGLELSDAQIKKIAEDIAIGKFNVETARNTLGLDKVGGTLLQNIVNEIYNMIGYDKNRADQKVDDYKK